MNKKSILMIAAGVLVIALLAAVYGIISYKKTDPNVSETPDEVPEIPVEKVFSANDIEKLSSIELSKDGETEYIIRKDATVDAFLIDGLETHNYSASFDNVLSSVTGLSVTGTIEDPNDDSEYGLSDADAPYILKVTDINGNTDTAYIGAKLLSGDGYYCKKDGKEGVFTIGNAANSFLKDKYSLISPLLAKELEQASYHYTESCEIHKNGKKLVKIVLVPKEEQDETDAYGYYRMEYPSSEYSVSDVNYDKMLKMLISPTADTVITTDLSDENLIKYGFLTEDGKPTSAIIYTHGGEERVIYFGKRTDDGLIYVMSPASRFIGIAGIERHFPFIDWELIDYVNPALFGMNIDHLARFSVSGEGFSNTYTLEGEIVKDQHGTVIDTQNFRSLYRVLLMTNMEGYADVKNTDDWMLTFSIEKRDGRISEYKFYRISNLKCYYTVNGKGEFYVSLDDVEKILSDAKKLASGETIDPDARV